MADLGKMEFTIRFIMIGDLIRNTVSISTMKESGKIFTGIAIRDIPQWKIREKKIGQTVYVVRYHFNEDAKETMQEKINRMLVTEASRMAVY